MFLGTEMKHTFSREQSGFSLIELLIVVAIILVLAAMAMPNFLRGKISANEASAVSSLRTIHTAQTSYAIAYPTIGYADELTKLSYPTGSNPVSSTSAGLIDWVLGCASQPCEKSGYMFSIVNATGTPVDAFEVIAVPKMQGHTGIRSFCSDQVPVIKYDPSGAPSCTKVLQ